jgi:hypothetical protein
VRSSTSHNLIYRPPQPVTGISFFYMNVNPFDFKCTFVRVMSSSNERGDEHLARDVKKNEIEKKGVKRMGMENMSIGSGEVEFVLYDVLLICLKYFWSYISSARTQFIIDAK